MIAFQIIFFIWLIGATIIAIGIGIDGHDYPFEPVDAIPVLLTILFWFFALMILLGQWIGYKRKYG